MIRKFLSRFIEENENGSEKKYVLINGAICALIVVISIIAYGFLPPEIPILHEGAKNIYIAKEIGIWMLPICAIVLNVLLYIQKRLNKLSSLIMVGLALFTVYTYVSML